MKMIVFDLFMRKKLNQCLSQRPSSTWKSYIDTKYVKTDFFILKLNFKKIFSDQGSNIHFLYENVLSLIGVLLIGVYKN